MTVYRLHCRIKSHPPSFGTRGRIILDVAIAYFYNTCFSFYSSLFYSTSETMARYKLGEAAPTPNGRLCRKCHPLKIGISHCSKRGLQKKYGCRFYSSQYRDFLSFSIFFAWTDDYATYFPRTDPPWRRLPAHVAAAATGPHAHPVSTSGH